MAKENPEQGLSTEVVGQLSDEQRLELSTLGLAILETRKLDPNKPEDVAVVQEVLEDCVYRGLEVQGRQWFAKTEKVTPIFQLGLDQRSQIIDKLKWFYENESTLRLLTHSEALTELSPFSPKFAELEAMVLEFTERYGIIRELHERLFSNPLLADDAVRLRQELNTRRALLVANPALLDYQKNNMLYANFLVNLISGSNCKYRRSS